MKRRKFLNYATRNLALLILPVTAAAQPDNTSRIGLPRKNAVPNSQRTLKHQSSEQLITIFLCGDVMTGRAIDQILPHPGKPDIYESYIQDARMYVKLAEKINGPIPKPVPFAYIWGDALAELDRVSPDLRIINLETSITRSDDVWPGKGINYRMHPRNIRCLTAAGIDACALANNHVLDWGYAGLEETLSTLKRAGITTCGAGANSDEAMAPAVFEIMGKGRVLLFSFGDVSSGVPTAWRASPNRAGIHLLDNLSAKTVARLGQQIKAYKHDKDIVIASIHWGGNWGYQISTTHARFARGLIDQAGVDIVHGHSSHHPKGIEIYRNRPIIYGCGDFINDYEGISGYEDFRSDLSLMYFISMNAGTGELVEFELVPTQIKNLRVNRANPADAKWLADMLNWEGRKLNTRSYLNTNGTLRLDQS
jgi:poly-gamma-glutamate synthesis protein (capsule biosynthesis protein)